jgi:hypothetical protein
VTLAASPIETCLPQIAQTLGVNRPGQNRAYLAEGAPGRRQPQQVLDAAPAAQTLAATRAMSSFDQSRALRGRRACVPVRRSGRTAHLPELSALSQYDAVASSSRHEAVAPDFEVTDATAPARRDRVRLDGLPLARLAAARAPALARRCSRAWRA